MEKKYYLRGLGLGIIVTAVIMGIALSGGTKKREMTDEEVIARAKELGMIEDTRLLEPSDEEGEETKPPEGDTAAADTQVKKDVAVKTEAELEKEEAQKPEDTAGAEEAKTEQKPTVDTPEPTVDTPEPVQTTTSAATTQTKPRADTNEMNKQDDEEKPTQAKTEENSDTKPTQAGAEETNDAPNASGGAKSITIVSGDSSYTVAKKLETTGAVSSASSYDTYLCEHGYDKKIRPGTFQIPAGATEEQIANIVTGQ